MNTAALLSRSSTLMRRVLPGLLALCAAWPVHAATVTVCAGGCDHTSIQDAVNAAQSGDRIELQTGFAITESVVVDGAKSLVIAGLGAGTTVIQADPLIGQQAGRVLVVGLLANVELRDLTLRHGDVTHLVGDGIDSSVGGAIYNVGTLTLRRVEILDNRARIGGGIWNEGSLTLIDTTVRDNRASSVGGGLYNVSTGTVVGLRATLANNRALSAGGGFDNRGSIELEYSSIVDNELDPSQGFEGAGGRISSSASLTLRDTTISGNGTVAGTVDGTALFLEGASLLERVEISGNGYGGGTVLVAPTLQMRQSRVVQNAGSRVVRTSGVSRIEASAIVDNQGTGLYVFTGVTDVTSSTISDNGSKLNGGGLHVHLATARVASSTIAWNGADVDQDSNGDGGGIWVTPGGTVELRNTIVANNTDNSPFLVDVRSHDCHGTITSFGYNLIENVDASTCTVTGTTAGNVIGMTPDIDQAADNGGPSPTVALQVGSPAIDGGDPTGCVDGDGTTLLPFDQRGGERVGTVGSNGPICDIGAYEFGAPVVLFEDGFESGDLAAWSVP